MTRRDILIQALASTPADIERLTRNLDHEDWQWRDSVEAWSIQDVLHHISHEEKLYCSYFELILAEEEPNLRRPSNRLVEDNPTIIGYTPIESFRKVRSDTLIFLSGLHAADWQRTAITAEGNRISLRFLVQNLVNHDIEHTNQLAEIMRRRRAYLNGNQSGGYSES